MTAQPGPASVRPHDICRFAVSGHRSGAFPDRAFRCALVCAGLYRRPHLRLLVHEAAGLQPVAVGQGQTDDERAGSRRVLHPLRYQPETDLNNDRFGPILNPATGVNNNLANWKTKAVQSSGKIAPVEIIVGILPATVDLKTYSENLAELGKVTFTDVENGLRVSLLSPSGQADAALKKLWAAGYTDAFALR